MNPWGYLQDHGKPKEKEQFPDEGTFNGAMVEALVTNKIEAISITDHHRVDRSASLAEAARAEGITVFPGFEYGTSDGIHFLCIFDPSVPWTRVRDRMVELKVDVENHSPVSGLAVGDFLDGMAQMDDGVAVAAHVLRDNGLLKVLENSGAGRVKAWRHMHLHAVAVQQLEIADIQDLAMRKILENSDANYAREKMPAILCANDVSVPEDCGYPLSSSYLKVSDLSVEGLRQAFLDPESRVRRSLPAEPHSLIEAISFEGGFFDGTRVRFSENLNVLIGGRGAGKSTLIEAIRHVLQLVPVGDTMRRDHPEIIRANLGPACTVRLWVTTSSPAMGKMCYLFSRTGSHPTEVRSRGGADKGEIIDAIPGSLVAGLQIYGQREISEIARDPQKRRALLGRFQPNTADQAPRKKALAKKLAESKGTLLQIQKEESEMKETAGSLAGLQEQLKRYKASKIQENLRLVDLSEREKEVFVTARERLEAISEFLMDAGSIAPIDTVFCSPAELDGMPNAELLVEVTKPLEELSLAMKTALDTSRKNLDIAVASVETVETKWKEKRDEASKKLSRAQEDLRREGLDPEAFVTLKRDIAEAERAGKTAVQLKARREAAMAQRAELLSEWQELLTEELRSLKTAAKTVAKGVGRIRAKVVSNQNTEPLEKRLRELGGKISPLYNRLHETQNLSLPSLAAACREGKDTLVEDFSLTDNQAATLIGGGENLFMDLEALELEPVVHLELNTATGDGEECWRHIDNLSAGQKATAVLLVLLHKNTEPILIDQPEDDLDNQFIGSEVVTRMREAKKTCQFIFASHNANIPVLGDAELVLVCQPEDHELSSIPDETLGSIDHPATQTQIQDLLEGGRSAFEERRRRYGFEHTP